MSYLVPSKGKLKNAAHLWTGEDTLCRMYSTGGLKLRRGYRITESAEGRRTCVMCQSVAEGHQVEERLAMVLAKEE